MTTTKTWYTILISLIVFVLFSSYFMVVFTKFRPICPPALFRCLSNSGTYTELRTTSFIDFFNVFFYLSIFFATIFLLGKIILVRFLLFLYQPSSVILCQILSFRRTVILFFKRVQKAGALEYTDCISVEEWNSSKEHPDCDIKLSDGGVLVMLDLCGVPLHCHRS